MSIGFGLIVRSRAEMPTLYAVYGVFTLLMNLHDFVAELCQPCAQLS